MFGALSIMIIFVILGLGSTSIQLVWVTAWQLGGDGRWNFQSPQAEEPHLRNRRVKGYEQSRTVHLTSGMLLCHEYLKGRSTY